MAISTSKLKWDKSLSVEDKELDEQHIRLLEFTNNLLYHYDGKDDPIAILKAIDSLVDFCTFHFDYEEDILRQRDYPYLDRHILLHEEFRTKVRDFKTKLNQGEENVMDQMIIYLISWIKDHSKEDLDYKNH